MVEISLCVNFMHSRVRPISVAGFGGRDLALVNADHRRWFPGFSIAVSIASTGTFGRIPRSRLQATWQGGAMRFVAVLNRDGGTLRTTDLDKFTERMRAVLGQAGHSLDLEIVEGKEVVSALAKAARRRSVDIVMAGGGDGTISAAAAALMNNKKALAILPAGTMNLFARSLGIPQSLDAALEAFASGQTKAVDVATANGRPFVHQFSIGLHAKMVHLRDQMEFGSRFGKMGASLKAAYRTVLKPPSMAVELRIGDAELVARTSGIGVSNNLFGEGHLPYADVVDAGTLGVYVTVARRRGELLRMAFNMARGKWRDNDQVEVHEASKVLLKIKKPNRKIRCVIDGELAHLDAETLIESHPGALNVLVPNANCAASAA